VQIPDILTHLGQMLLEHGVRSARLVCVDGRCSQHGFAVRDAVDDSGLGSDRHVVADGDVTDDAHLSADDAVVPQGRRAGDPDLSDEKAMRADLRAMSDGYEIAQLAAPADDRIVERASLDAATASDLDVVLDHKASDLRYLVMHSLVRGVAESIDADRRVRIDDDALADAAAFVNRGVRIDNAVVADFDPFPDIDAGVYDAPVAYSRVVGKVNA